MPIKTGKKWARYHRKKKKKESAGNSKRTAFQEIEKDM